MTKQDLREYGFTQDFNILYCRKCKRIIPKYSITILLGVDVKYGYCRFWTHGISVCRLMK